jgi:16S rRNA (guanine527-N7)-methyltransferase
MNELKVIQILKNDLGFSNSSIEKIKKFNNYLLKYNKSYNLISKSTENNIWYRHILDSAQIIKFIDFSKIKNLADFGSGAGFPGLILALYDGNSSFHVKLYEKSSVKRNFLNMVKHKLALKNVEVKDNVYDKFLSTDIIVCRAFKKLNEIIRISREITEKPHKLIILKGKNAQIEINNVSLDKNYSYKLISSITDKNSKIILIDAKKNDS